MYNFLAIKIKLLDIWLSQWGINLNMSKLQLSNDTHSEVPEETGWWWGYKGMISFIAYVLCYGHCVMYNIKISSFVSLNSLKTCTGTWRCLIPFLPPSAEPIRLSGSVSSAGFTYCLNFKHPAFAPYTTSFQVGSDEVQWGSPTKIIYNPLLCPPLLCPPKTQMYPSVLLPCHWESSL